MKKEIISIFFAATPFHIICLNELYSRDKSINHELILLLRRKNDFANKQIYLTMDKLGFKDYTLFWIPKIRIFRFLAEMILVFQIKYKHKDKEKLFTIYDFRDSFMQSLRRFFRKANFTLIDDGFSTYVAQEKYMSKNIYLPIERYDNISGFITKWLYFGFDFNRLKHSPFKIFTIYGDEIKDRLVEFNRLVELRRILKNLNGSLAKNKVFYAGSGMAERGVITIEEEMELVVFINEYWKRRGKTMYYVAKKSTSNKKLQVFKENDIKTLRFDLPLEIALTEIDELPSDICANGSTLLKSIPLIFDKKITCHYIDVKEYFMNNSKSFSQMKFNDVMDVSTNYIKNSPNIKKIF